MWNAVHDAYLEDRILSADPIELVCLLYQGSLTAIDDAREHLRAGEIAARSRAIAKARDIVLELNAALDHASGGEISRGLAQIYDYLLRRLVDANLEASDTILAEVGGLLSTLAEGWQAIGARGPLEAPESSHWAQPAVAEAGLEYASQGWSL